MATPRQSIASELLQRIKKTGYNVVVPYLDSKTALSARDVRRLKGLMRQSGKDVETDRFYTRKGTVKPNAIFDVFGEYCGKSGSEVREMMVDYVRVNRRTVQAELRNALDAQKKDLPWWSVKQTNAKTPGDELTIYLLSKMFDHHSLIYTLKEPWCTFVHKTTDELSVLLSKSDLVFVYTQYGFGQIINGDSPSKAGKPVKRRSNDQQTTQKRRNNDTTKSVSKKRNLNAVTDTTATTKVSTSVSTSKQKGNPTKRARVTPSITPYINKVSASVSTDNIIETERAHNTRGRKTQRRRTNPREECKTKRIDYTKYYSSGDDSGNETSPSPKKSRSIAEISLREPTPSRLKSQSIITRQRLQELSPTRSKVRLIGTVISPRPLQLKPKIKKEPIVKSEKDAEIADYLSKGLCLSAHTNGSACANIQNPNNINVKPMGIREHRKKQRIEKAIYEAHMRAVKEKRINQKENKTESTNEGTVIVTQAEIHNTESNSNLPLAENQTEPMNLDLFSSAILNDAISELQQVNDSCPDAQFSGSIIKVAETPRDVEQDTELSTDTPALQLFSDADDDDIDQNKAELLNINPSSSDITVYNQIAVTFRCDSASAMPEPQSEPESSTPTPATLDTESDNDTVIYTSDTCSPLLSGNIEQVTNLDSTTDYTNQDDNPSETDLEEIILNKGSIKTYSRKKQSPSPSAGPPITVDSTTNTDIDMADDTTGTDMNMELLNLSDNFAESLAITDLEELMDESETPGQTILPTRPQSPEDPLRIDSKEYDANQAYQSLLEKTSTNVPHVPEHGIHVERCVNITGTLTPSTMP